MAMFDSELLKRFHYLSLVSRQAGDRSLIASPRGGLSGVGGQIIGRRDYVPGDDYRHIDWTWCARRDELSTKIFPPCEDRHVYILLDCSPSMGLGRPPKFHLARRIAAGLSYLALNRLDRLALVAFSDGIVAQSPPVRHRARLPVLLRFLEQLTTEGISERDTLEHNLSAQSDPVRTGTDLERAAEAFVRRRQRPGPVVVISDLYDANGFQGGLDILLGRGYEPRLVRIYDPAEARPTLLGDLDLYDVETHTSRRATITERARRRYGEIFTEFCRSVRRYCARRGITYVPISSDASEEEVLLKVLGARGTSVGEPTDR